MKKSFCRKVDKTMGRKRTKMKGDKLSFQKSIKKYWILYLMLFPGILYFAVFKYGAMFGLITAFYDYRLTKGIFGSEFVGLKHFIKFFGSNKFGTLFINTLRLAICNILLFFPLPIIVALLINELKSKKLKSVVQAVIYIPHFVSWVVVASIVVQLFNSQDGAITQMIKSVFGIQINLLSNSATFVGLITGEQMWKEFGWGTIIFLSALAGVDLQLYEAAKIDGASRFQRVLHITLPALKPTIIIQLILRMGSFMNTGFEQILLTLNSSNRSVGEVFDTYVYQMALQNGKISYGTAIGMFKSVIGLILVIGVNTIAKKLGEEGVY